jgi:hypothetical protein
LVTLHIARKAAILFGTQHMVNGSLVNFRLKLATSSADDQSVCEEHPEKLCLNGKIRMLGRVDGLAMHLRSRFGCIPMLKGVPMTIRFRSGAIVAIAAFLFEVCSSSALACSRTSSAAPQAHGSRDEKKSESGPAIELTPEQLELGLRRFVYSEEIKGLRWEEIRAQQAIDAGKKPISETSYRGILSAEEERIARDILLDASHRIDELDRQFMILNDEVHEHYSAELAARRDAIDPQRLQILDQAVADLKSSLGEDAFEKFDKYLYQTFESSGRIKVTSPKDPNK